MFVCNADPLPTPTPIVHRSCIHLTPPHRSPFAPLPITSLVCWLRPEHQPSPLDILAQPPDSLSVSLPHDHTAHEDLDRSNALKRHLALARGLVQAQCRAKLVFRYSLGVINLVAEDNEGGVLEFLHSEKSIELGLGLVEALVVLCVDEENNTGNFRDCRERMSATTARGQWDTSAYSSRAIVVALVRDRLDQRL
jgi:hypothetical protein